MSQLEFILQSREVDGANALARVLPPRSGFISILQPKLQGAVHEVIAKCREGGTIKTIYIVGHGSPDGQEFGTETADMITPAAAAFLSRELSVGARPGSDIPPDGPHILRTLLPFYQKGGQLILGGCRVGSGETAKLLSVVMPNILVSAFTMAQLPTGMGDAGSQIFYMNGVLMRSEFHKTVTSILSIPQSFAQWSGLEQ